MRDNRFVFVPERDLYLRPLGFGEQAPSVVMIEPILHLHGQHVLPLLRQLADAFEHKVELGHGGSIYNFALPR